MAKSKTLPGMIVDLLASYGLATLLLVLLFILTLLGTFAQVDHGIYMAQKKYFESWFLLHELGPIVVPLPGAMTCLSLLAVNLFLGGLIRIRKNKSTYGVIVIHIGIVVMLAAAVTKLTASEEGRLTLFEGEASDEFIHFYEWEVAVFDVKKQTMVDEWIIPHAELNDLLQGKKRTFEFPDGGFELVLSNFVPNGRPMPKGPNWHTPYPTIDGFAVRESVFDAEAAERNVACLYVEALVPGQEGAPMQGILTRASRFPWTFKAGDKEWAVSMRHRRMSMPFNIALDNFTRELHPGTQMAKVYASDVTKTDVESRSTQKVKISMNEPLRSEGLVLFQSSWGPPNAREGDALYSQFSVVRNPSDAWPLYSCIIITLGLLMTFSQKLASYIRKQNASRAKQLAGGTA